MTVYPSQIDTDLQLPVIDDGVTQLSGSDVNPIREAVLAIEETLGVDPQGTKGTLAARLAESINLDGTIKDAALTLAGLLTGPIVNSDVANAAGIVESKLALDYSTSDLFSLVTAQSIDVASLVSSLALLSARYSQHKLGTPDGNAYENRHVASHVDINDGTTDGGSIQYAGNDARDLTYNNTGLLDATGSIRNAKTVMDALLSINSDLVDHILSVGSPIHTASFIRLDTDGFTLIPASNTTVQAAITWLDQHETELFNEIRADLHTSGIPKASRVTYDTDGYNVRLGPFDGISENRANNESVVYFAPSVVQLDWAFRQIETGDKATVTFSTPGTLGEVEVTYVINEVRYSAGILYEVVLDGFAISTGDNVSITLEKSAFDVNNYGVLAVAAANHGYYTGLSQAVCPSSAVVVNPNSAVAIGNGLSLDDLDEDHYMLYLGYYPTGNPADKNIIFPTLAAIDVTGNLGVTPGKYTLEGVISEVNKKFRAGGYNYRFVAFEYKGNFGIAIADDIDNAGFSIITGSYSGSTLNAGTFVKNVVGDATSPVKDPLGFGAGKANVASPQYGSSTMPTKVFLPRKRRKYNVNGQYIDYLANGYATNADGYYAGYFTGRTPIGGARLQGTYNIPGVNLGNSKLKPGCTVVILPDSSTGDSTYNNRDYGRFIVESVPVSCDANTEFTVISCVSTIGLPLSGGTDPSLYVPDGFPVRIYFSDDSILFPSKVIGGGNYKRHFEIFAKNDGHTFAHERARFLLAAASGHGLDTTLGSTSLANSYGWHVTGVSDKLRGFIPANYSGTSNSRWLRFIIFNYDASNDSYDGYVGQPDEISFITNLGPTVHVRKGDVATYYDVSGVDSINIQFDESVSSPLDMSFTSGDGYRWMDIEIFPTIATNDSYLKLASCEQFVLGDLNSIWKVADCRQFGTISEKDFSTSAIKFIEASDRWFSPNAVANGFEFLNMTSSTISFTGGIALINGTMVTKNEFTVHPFQMSTASPPTTVTYALCINQVGGHELVAIDSSSSNVEYTTGWERVYTLLEIENYRKDLLPIYIISITTASLTIDAEPYDVRKFSKSLDTCLFVHGAGNGGYFKSWAAAANYIKYGAGSGSTLYVCGNSQIDANVNFGTNPVTIIGDQKYYITCTVENSPSIALGSNMTIDGVNFLRAFGSDVAVQPYYTGGYGKATLGLIMTNGVKEYENINIKNCTFNTVGGYRKSNAAHILFEQTGDGAILKNINIVNNTFKEIEAQLDIAFVNKGGITVTTSNWETSSGTVLSSVNIDNNKGYFGSWVILSSDNTSTSSRGLSTYNVNISKNTFDFMWLNVSKYVYHSTSESGASPYKTDIGPLFDGLMLNNNTINALDPLPITHVSGGSYALTPTVASPATHVLNNRFGRISIQANIDSYRSAAGVYIDYYFGNLIVKNNTITTNLYATDVVNAAAAFNTAIYISGNSSGFLEKNPVVFIEENIITDIGDLAGVGGKKYSTCISANRPASIKNNTINKAISDNGFGIYCVGKSLVTGNNIIRGSTAITAYIYLVLPAEPCAITDNIFDSSTTNGTSQTVINISSNAYKVICERNVNQTFNISALPCVDLSVVGFYGSLYTSTGDYTSGWIKRPIILSSASNTTINSIRLQTNMDLIKILIPAATSVKLSPITVNIPQINGAKPQKLSFTIVGENSVETSIKLMANCWTSRTSQNMSINMGDAASALPLVNPATGSNVFTLTTVPTTFEIDLSALTASNFSSILSSSRTLQVAIMFVYDTGGLSGTDNMAKLYDATDYYQTYNWELYYRW